MRRSSVGWKICWARPEGRLADVEDLWLFLHLLFEAMWEFRFLYRDLDEILSRDRDLAVALHPVHAPRRARP